MILFFCNHSGMHFFSFFPGLPAHRFALLPACKYWRSANTLAANDAFSWRIRTLACLTSTCCKLFTSLFYGTPAGEVLKKTTVKISLIM